MTTSEFIFAVTSSFYDKAREDVLIGYHFRNIADFDTHIPRIAAFWDIQLTGKTHRRLDHPFDMMGVHLPLGIKRGELGRWLVLFKKTLDEKVLEHPEFKDLKDEWLDRLGFFEKVFLRFLGFQA